MSLTLRVLDESTDTDSYTREMSISDAWHRWALESCVEWNRGHLWDLELLHQDDGGGVELCCSYCPATVEDLCPDGVDLISGEVAGVDVRNGLHNSDVSMTVPVTAKVLTEHYSNPIVGNDWSVDILVTQRGPVTAVWA